MNEIQLGKVRQGILEVLDRLDIQAMSDPEDKNLFAADIVTGDMNGMMMKVYLYVTIKAKNQVVTVEAEIQDEIAEDKITQVMELVNLINRQLGVRHSFVHLRDKTVFFKKDISLVNNRINKSELEWSINDLLNNVAFYFVGIEEIAYFDETLDEMSKRYWANCSYLHKECKSDEQEKAITREIGSE